REKQGGTFVGEDVLMPHARIEGIASPIVALGVSRLGILDWQTGRKAKIMFLLLSPEERPDCHVEQLGMLSRLACDYQWLKSVLAYEEPSEVIESIQKKLGEE
ncbi:MAG: PTS sugar transporter subunit IIA, partial [Candidatus Dadabacteria bacterium]|nr:PTS sugar transporter subunit IIA [Candidatus Dadabacteria bacterium]